MFKKLVLFLSFFVCALASERPLKFFSLDLHISVIADLRDIFESEGHEVKSWCISDHTWVFGKQRDSVEVVNEKTWKDLDKRMCDRFYERYKDELSQYDAFIVTHNASFALLYEKFNKPIVIVNSTRYENPFTQSPEKWAWLNEYLKSGVKNRKIFIVSNNKGDQAYLKRYTGLDSEVIPSLCLYTRAAYSGKTEGFIGRFPGHIFKSFAKKQLGSDKNLIRKPRHGYTWQELYDYQGIVHFPYQISTMSIFEQYSANVPLFLPSKKFILALQKAHPQILCQLSFFKADKAPSRPGDLNNVNDPQVVAAWVEAADFYDPENMPHIQYFDSFEQLKQILKTADCKTISGQMKAYNEKRKARAVQQWRSVLEKVRSSISN
jgi:hypothetical protein